MSKTVIKLEKFVIPGSTKTGMDIEVIGDHEDLVRMLIELQVMQPAFNILLKDAVKYYEDPINRERARNAIDKVIGSLNVAKGGKN